MHWRPQEVGDVGAKRHETRRVAEREWNQCKREKSAVGSKAGKEELSKSSDISHGITGHGVCPAGLLSCFGPAFLYYASILLFWNVYSVRCLLEVCKLLLRDDLDSQKRLWAFTLC